MRPGTIALLALAVGVSSSQLPLERPAAEPEVIERELPMPGRAQLTAAYSETLMSTLSASSQHGTFIHLLQRSKLVPMLSRMNGSIFAPTDDAWKKWDEDHRPEDEPRAYGWLGTQGLDEWLVDEDTAEAALAKRIAMAGVDEAERIRAEADNQNWALRQHMLYHILNYTLTEHDWAPRDTSNLSIETTLLYPAGRAPTPSPIPEPGTPWTPGVGKGLLGSHGQRLRLALPGSAEGGEGGLVGFDHLWEGGAPVWDGAGWEDHKDPNNTHIMPLKDKHKHPGVRWVRNGVVIGLDGVLNPPKTLLDTLRTTPELAYLAQLIDGPQRLPEPLPGSLNNAPHVTLFVGSEDAYKKAFDDIERGYLEGGFGAEGLARVLAPGTLLHIDKKSPVGWSDTWGKKPTNVTSASGVLEISAKNGSVTVNGTEATTVDIFTDNGVIHIMPELLIPPGFELLNSAEKVLLSRNATRFVSLMRSANLSTRYIGEPDKKGKQEFTILAPTDEAIDYMGYLGTQGVFPMDITTLLLNASDAHRPSPHPPPVDDTSPLASLLKYHILPGSYAPGDIKDGMLLGTELKTPELGGDRQRIHVEVSERRKPNPDWNVEDGEISFGGAMVVGSPIKSGDTIIYFMSAILAPPLDVLQTAVGDLQLSTYIAAVYAAGLERWVKKNPATTYFIPRNKAFNNLGLAMKYLLLPEGRDELRKVIRYHAVDKILYTADIEIGLSVLKTLEGGNLVLDRSDNGNFTLRSPAKWPNHDSGASIPSNGDLRSAVMRTHNDLTETGVIHTIDSVVLPSDIDISIAKLIRGAKHRTMPELMTKAGLAWILEGREPTEEEVERAGLQDVVRAHTTTKGGKKERDDENNPDPDDLALPAYTVLVPSDKAFSRINMTYYLNEPEALLDLLKLHIIPSNLGAAIPQASREHAPKSPPNDNTPLALEDDVVYPTLLSPKDKYGELAFRVWEDEDFLVGIRNARAGSNERPARTGQAGRATVRWKQGRSKHDVDAALFDGSDDAPPTSGLWRGGMTLGGGVIVIDTVLEPYHPGWYTRWGWLLLTIVGTVAIVSLLGFSVWWWWSTTKKKREGYERVAAEEEEARQEEENRHWRRLSRGQ